MVFVKIRKHHICPVRLVRALFAQVAEDGLPLSRHLVRIVPLQRVFFPDEQELTHHIRALVGLPPVVVKKVEEIVSEKAEVEEREEKEGEERAVKRTRVEVKEEEEDVKEETSLSTQDVPVEDCGEQTETKTETATETETVPGTELAPSSSSSSAVAPSRDGLPPLTYNLTIKIRNHDTLKKSQITHCVTSNLPRHQYHYNYKEFKVCAVYSI